MIDSVSDMLTRIRNAQAAAHQSAILPFSKLRLNLAKLLEKEGLIDSVSTHGRKAKKVIEIGLRYQAGRPVISKLERISKPGRRVYLKRSQIRPVSQGHGLAVISTSQGLMTDRQARKKGLGGEILCQIW